MFHLLTFNNLQKNLNQFIQNNKQSILIELLKTLVIYRPALNVIS